MLFALRALSRTQYAAGSTLQFPGDYHGIVEDGMLILSRRTGSATTLSDVVFMQPIDWPISKAQAGGPDPNQLTLADAETAP